MNTHKTIAMMMPKEPVFAALMAFVLGSVIGYTLGKPPSIPYSCQTQTPLRAHFLEKSLRYDVSQLPLRLQQRTVALRAAAPEEEPAAEGSESRSSSVADSLSSDFSSSSSSSSSTSSVPGMASSADSASSSASMASSAETDGTFPAFGRAAFPVGRVPNWGAMKTAAEWNRDYADMARTEFVRIPPYDPEELAIPMKELLKTRDDPDTVRILTAKLFYSTKFFGSYDLDAGEFSGDHAGIDLKLPEGTPVESIGGGRVSSVHRDATGLGTHVVVEHRLDDGTYYAIYGHLRSVAVRVGQDVATGQTIGWSGSTGRSTSGHLHLQVDRGEPNETEHEAYWPGVVPTKAEADKHTVHPLRFIDQHR